MATLMALAVDMVLARAMVMPGLLELAMVPALTMVLARVAAHAVVVVRFAVVDINLLVARLCVVVSSLLDTRVAGAPWVTPEGGGRGGGARHGEPGEPRLHRHLGAVGGGGVVLGWSEIGRRPPGVGEGRGGGRDAPGRVGGGGGVVAPLVAGDGDELNYLKWISGGGGGAPWP